MSDWQDRNGDEKPAQNDERDGQPRGRQEEKSQPAIFMNMCMIEDGKGNVLVLHKVNDSYTGVTFPGGHVEPGESYYEAVVREVKEETGLAIGGVQMCGVYHWEKNGILHVVFLYQADQFEGELTSSEEGEVYWLPKEEFLGQKLAVGMDRVWKIMHSDQIMECHMVKDTDDYQPHLY